MAWVLWKQTWTECYKNMYDNSLDHEISDIIQCVGVPQNTLFKIIENISKNMPQ